MTTSSDDTEHERNNCNSLNVRLAATSMQMKDFAP
jgi:hypothetical protein